MELCPLFILRRHVTFTIRKLFLPPQVTKQIGPPFPMGIYLISLRGMK